MCKINAMTRIFERRATGGTKAKRSTGAEHAGLDNVANTKIPRKTCQKNELRTV